MNKKLDAFHLKIIAVTAMAINHAGIIFAWSHSANTIGLYAMSEFVGRFTFPIMAYLLVEGFHYTKNLRKYCMRLILFWLVSIYPFYLMHNPTYTFSITDIPNNIFFTLLMGLLMMIVYSRTNNKAIHVLIVLGFSLLTVLSDWSIVGVLIIWSFYVNHNQKGKTQTIISTFIIFEIISIVGLIMNNASPSWIAEAFSQFGFLVVLFLLLQYNGERGYSPKWIKWGFYWFYPIHLVVFELIRYFIF
ncbi:fimbrial assembly protein fimC [Enterococcus silesiacus]|nr:TraX family protein [Enterococcus silesiacus]ALS00915.1 fimbrial assembly protein fimC [Enterococcus silesiacus]